MPTMLDHRMFDIFDNIRNHKASEDGVTKLLYFVSNSNAASPDLEKMLNKYELQNPRCEKDYYNSSGVVTCSGTEIPVLITHATAKVSIANLARQILTDMGQPLITHLKSHSLIYMAEGLLDKCKVELLIISNAELLLTGLPKKTVMLVIDWLITIAEKCGFAIILIGEQECRDKQLEYFGTRLKYITNVADTLPGR